MQIWDFMTSFNLCLKFYLEFIMSVTKVLTPSPPTCMTSFMNYPLATFFADLFPLYPALA